MGTPLDWVEGLGGQRLDEHDKDPEQEEPGFGDLEIVVLVFASARFHICLCQEPPRPKLSTLRGIL